MLITVWLFIFSNLIIVKLSSYVATVPISYIHTYLNTVGCSPILVNNHVCCSRLGHLNWANHCQYILLITASCVSIVYGAKHV